MASHKLLNNFTGGELSPQLDARIDLQKYDSGCRKLENMRPLPWGGATFRAGTLYIAPAKYSDRPCRLIPFNVSTGISYVLEMGDHYIRFLRDGKQVLNGDAEAWAVGVYYPVGAMVTVLGVTYRCIVAHTGGTLGYDFATELTIQHYWTTATASTPFEIASDYGTAELFELQFKEINDVIYVSHSSRYPVKVSRFAHTSWSYTPVQFKYPVLLDENADDAKTIQLAPVVATAVQAAANYRIITTGSTDFTLIGAADSDPGTEFTATGAGLGTGTAFQLTGTGAPLVASFDAFTAQNVGSYWEIRHQREATQVTADLSVTTPGLVVHSDTIKVKGDWTLVTTERWYGVLSIERSTDGGTTWMKIATFNSASSRNVNDSGTQDEEALFRLSFICTGDPYGTPPWTGTAPTTFVKALATFEVGDSFIAGLVIVSAVTDSRHATCNIVNSVENEQPTAIWSEGAFSDRRGYPRAVGLFEQRLFYAGTSWKPNTVWGSVVADFDNFTFSDLDDAAVAYQFASAQQNPIQWLSSLLRMHAGTSGGEHMIASGNLDEPLTPSNVVVRDPSAYGSEYMQALKIDSALLFLQRQGRRIREIREMSVYSNPADYFAPDLTLLAEHITSDGIYQMDFARLPDPQVLVVMNNGRIGVMTYNKEQNINAWSQYSTPGTFISLAVVYGTPADVVYVVVERNVGGAVVKYLEVFTAPQGFEALDVFMDAAVVYSGSPTTTVSGLSHLNGQTVVALADSAVVEGLVVSGGQVTLPQAASNVSVGLGYQGYLWPMKIDQQLANGTSQGRMRRISELCIRFKDTGGRVLVGNGSSTAAEVGSFAQEANFRTTDDPMDSAPPLHSGDYFFPWEAGPDLKAAIQITVTQPVPCTVLGLFAKMEVFGE